MTCLLWMMMTMRSLLWNRLTKSIVFVGCLSIVLELGVVTLNKILLPIFTESPLNAEDHLLIPSAILPTTPISKGQVVSGLVYIEMILTTNNDVEAVSVHFVTGR